MQEEKDYLMRDIERMTLFLKILLQRIAGLTDENFESEYEQIEVDLKEKLDINLFELSEMDEITLLQKLEKLHISYVEKFVEIVYEFLKDIENLELIDKKQNLVSNTIKILDFIDKNSMTYSLQRSTMRDYLKTINS